MPDEIALSPIRVLFLCTHNSSRSQMAEGLLRAVGGDRYDVYSAGTHPRQVHPLAIAAMRELEIDLSTAAGYRAKSLRELEGQPFDLVMTVCDEAAEECPYFAGAKHQEHWSFPDPSAATGTEEQRLAVFRQVRDAIAARIDAWLVDNGARQVDES
ncbi:MAG TPA: arsenate reductase ArsC [Ktedonobacterales bacterium]